MLAAPVTETLQHVSWMLVGLVAAAAGVLLAEALPGDPGWPAVAALLIGAGTALVAAALLRPHAEARERVGAIGAALLAMPGLLLGTVPHPAVAVPGMLVPLAFLVRPFSPGLRVASVALLSVAGVALQSAVPSLGARFAVVWLLVLGVAVLVWFRLPAEGPWRSILLPGAAGVALFVAAL